jgi:hypothetical protein
VEGCAIGLAEKHKSICIYEMVGRIGLETGSGALPRFGLNYASAMRRCERCQTSDAPDYRHRRLLLRAPRAATPSPRCRAA